MPSWMTTKGKFEVGNLDADAADLRIMLVSAPPASQAAAEDLNFLSQVTASEIVAATRKTLAGETLTENDTNDRAELTATNPSTYTGLNGPTIAGGWIYRQVTNDADSPLWCFLDVTDIVTNGGDVTLSFGANGFLWIT